MQAFNEPGLVSGTRCSGCVRSFPAISFSTVLDTDQSSPSGGRREWVQGGVASLGSTAGGMDVRAGEAFLKVGLGELGAGEVQCSGAPGITRAA